MLAAMGVWRWMLVSLALVACGAGQAHTPAPQSRVAPTASASSSQVPIERGSIADLDKREIAAGSKQTVTVGKLTATVEGVAPPTVESKQSTTHITVAFASPMTTMDCYVYPTAIDPGSRAMAIVNALKATPSKLSVVSVAPVDAAVVREHVALFVDVEYSAKQPEEVVGLVKLAVFSHPTTPFLCLHDQVGFHQTFKRVVLGLAESIRLAGDEAAEGRYAEIEIEKVSGHPVGFTRTDVIDGEGGTKVYESLSTSLFQRSTVDVMVSDSARVETWDPDGYIRSIRYAEVEGGDMSEDLTLTRAGARDYTYEGTHAGKKISGKLRTKGPHGFESDMRTDREIDKLLVSGGELRIEGYHPDVDPTAPVESVVRVVSKADRTVTFSFGKVVLTGKLDEAGRMVSGEMALGAATFTTERVLVRGSY